MTPTFFRLYSESLNEEITILVDPLAIDMARLTKNLIYREQELDILLKIGAGPETLQNIHNIKKFFRGWIVSCELPENQNQE